jgi:hypothetical protein
MADYLPFVLNALTLISILMLVSLGLAIIFGLMNVINLAHGEFITLGAFTLVAVQVAGGSFWIALLVAPVVGFAIGLVLERVLIARVYADPLHAILVTRGAKPDPAAGDPTGLWRGAAAGDGALPRVGRSDGGQLSGLSAVPDRHVAGDPWRDGPAVPQDPLWP